MVASRRSQRKDNYRLLQNEMAPNCNGRIQLRLTVMIRGNQSFLREAYVKENEKTGKRKLARLKTYAELIRRGQYTVCGRWGKPT